MKFNEKINTEHNIVKYSLTTDYNEELTDDESMEIETLHDYIRKLKFANIDFTANVTMSDGKPVVTDEDISDTVVEVSLIVAPKEYILDENLDIQFSIDAGRIADTEINEVLKTKVLVSQAKIAVFQNKIKEEVLRLLEEARNEDNSFEQESEVIM
ncbi:MAG: hypothetical protein HDT22_10495 [Ruminococcus sp.]|nr:hypothetical protein [Ruminococcus sp.]